MHIIYYIDGIEYKTDYKNQISFYKISSLDEITPAFENLKTGFKYWCEKGRNPHRLIGPAIYWSDGREEFCLNGKYYENVKDWINNHPKPDLYFHNIGVFNETDKILWFLQN
jgi:hypothetical protein